MPRGLSDYDTAKLQGRLWTPAVLRPALWFDAADLSTITVATGVSEWRDKSGFGQNATQGTGANQPTISFESFNGLNTLLFDGVNNFLEYDGSFLAGTSYFVTIVFARMATGQCYILGSANIGGPNNANLHCGYRATTTLTHAQYGNDLDATVATYSGTPALEIFAGRKIAAVGGGTILRQNGNARASNSNTTGLASYSNARVARWENTLYKANVGEIVAATEARGGDLNLSTIHKMEGYLSWKWGIRLAADHPYANRPPLIGD